MAKADADIVTLLFVIIITIVTAVIAYELFVKGSNNKCKELQMKDLGRVTDELDRFEKKNTTLYPASFNTVQDFKMNSACISKLEYIPPNDPTKQKGTLKITWTDGIVQTAPMEAIWSMENGSNLLLEKGTAWNMKVYRGKVVAVPIESTL
jgi:hypothetical protein